MIVYHSDRLHQRVTDRRSDKFESSQNCLAFFRDPAIPAADTAQMRCPFQPLSTAILVILAIIRLSAAAELADCLLEEEKPYSFKLSVTPASGYNSDVILLGEGLPLPPGISRPDAEFFEFSSAATFDWKSIAKVFFADQPPSKDQITASYEYKGDFYEGISGFDPGVHTWSAKYTHLFDKRFGYRIEAKDIYATIDGHSYSNKVGVAPALTLKATEYASNIAKDLTTELVFSFVDADSYFPPSLPARATSANNFSGELSVTFIPKLYESATLKIGFVHYRNDANGSDYDYDRNRLQWNLETRFSSVPNNNRWYDLKAIIKYFHDFDDYDRPNSRTRPVSFAFRRRDARDDLQAGLTFDVLKNKDQSSKFAVNLLYHYLRQDSNVSFFNYPQHTILAGCTYTFDDLKWR
jgi:hypothetical protein